MRIFVGNWGTVTGGIIQGITLICNTDTQLQILDKGILMAVPVKDGYLTTESSLVLYKNGNLDIEANGDINITSKNGKVNINWKR
ncbi:hypothetical protein BMS3Abin03_01397 [bacterium BMS3Abin03]|nr:hypothetical protein BMS3Abin03_01397 [bacterium BMS3Abin03]